MPDTWLTPLVQQARALSSGTLASLTGYTRYDEVDPVYADFIDFCEENVNRFHTWVEAWNEFKTFRQFPRQ